MNQLEWLALLREFREKQGLRQIDVAEKLDCPETRVSKYELGTRRLDLLELRDVCKVLGVSLVDFVRTFDTAVGALESVDRNGTGKRGRSRIKE
jgi:transcriptional regulator with XRE-family HTH domain